MQNQESKNTVEALEPRLFMAAQTAVLVGTILTIEGTINNDGIDVNQNTDATTGAVVIEVPLNNGNTYKTPLSVVTRIVINGLDGDDRIDCSSVASGLPPVSIPVSIIGGAGNDNLRGGTNNDIIRGGLGNDIISGLEGSDKITGDEGDDLISGNAQNDGIDGGDGADRLNGQGGRDKISGGSGADRIFGGPSGDFLAGQGNPDEIFGEGGNDRISGGIGEGDTLHGNAGDDILVSNDGFTDFVFGDGGIHDSAITDDIDSLLSIENKLE